MRFGPRRCKELALRASPGSRRDLCGSIGRSRTTPVVAIRHDGTEFFLPGQGPRTMVEATMNMLHRTAASMILPLGIALVLASVTGCSSNTSGNTTSVACRAATLTTPKRPADFHGTIFTIVMENHSAGDIFGAAEAPFINTLANQNAVAAGYHDSYVHPSEPNYIWMVSGQNFGILTDDDPGPTAHAASTSHLADQLELAGLTWKSYQESMGAPCGLTAHGPYAPKHNPFLYFDDVNGWDGQTTHVTPRCQEHIVDYSQFDVDLAAGKLPNYVFITPNLDNDMHDGSVAAGDAWLAREVPKILGSEAFNNGGVLFLLWDEGGGYPQQDDPPFIAISPMAKPGFVSHVNYDTSSFLKTVQAMLGIEALPCAADPNAVQTMSDLFTAPM
jgi:acid phosphatase